MSILHNLTHKHVTAEKDGIGIFLICIRRWPSNRVTMVQFLPALPRADATHVPGVQTMSAMLTARSALEAMSILRANLDAGEA